MKKTGWRELRKRLLALGIAAVMIGNTVDLSVLPVLAQETEDTSMEGGSTEEFENESEPQKEETSNVDDNGEETGEVPENTNSEQTAEEDADNEEEITDEAVLDSEQTGADSALVTYEMTDSYEVAAQAGEAALEVTKDGESTKEYASFDAWASNGTISDNCTIKLLSDITLTQTLTFANGTITLDLNGKTLSTGDENTVNVKITSGSNVTITSTGSKGTLTGKAGTWEPYGTVKIENGGSCTIKNDVSVNNSRNTNSRAIYNTGGNLAIEAGAETSAYTGNLSIEIGDGGTAKITGGDFNGGIVVRSSAGDVEISGGTFRYNSNTNFGAICNQKGNKKLSGIIKTGYGIKSSDGSYVDLDSNDTITEEVEVVKYPLYFTEQPAIDTINAQALVGYKNAPKLTVQATDGKSTDGITYKWHVKKTLEEATDETIFGADSKIYQIPSGLTVGTYEYYCVASKGNDTATSNHVMFTVTAGYVQTTINETRAEYLSMQEALAAIDAAVKGADGKTLDITLTLKKDINIHDNNGASIDWTLSSENAKRINVTLDLNGKKTSTTQNGRSYLNDLKLTFSGTNVSCMLKDSVAGGKGTSDSGNLFGIVQVSNDAKLTVESGKYEQINIWSDCEIKAGSYAALNAYGGSRLKITGADTQVTKLYAIHYSENNGSTQANRAKIELSGGTYGNISIATKPEVNDLNNQTAGYAIMDMLAENRAYFASGRKVTVPRTQTELSSVRVLSADTEEDLSQAVVKLVLDGKTSYYDSWGNAINYLIDDKANVQNSKKLEIILLKDITLTEAIANDQPVTLPKEVVLRSDDGKHYTLAGPSENGKFLMVNSSSRLAIENINLKNGVFYMFASSDLILRNATLVNSSSYMLNLNATAGGIYNIYLEKGATVSPAKVFTSSTVNIYYGAETTNFTLAKGSDGTLNHWYSLTLPENVTLPGTEEGGVNANCVKENDDNWYGLSKKTITVGNEICTGYQTKDPTPITLKNGTFTMPSTAVTLQGHQTNDSWKCKNCGKTDLAQAYKKGALNVEGLKGRTFDTWPQMLTRVVLSEGGKEQELVKPEYRISYGYGSSGVRNGGQAQYYVDYNNYTNAYTYRPGDEGFEADKAPKATITGLNDCFGTVEIYYTIGKGMIAEVEPQVYGAGTKLKYYDGKSHMAWMNSYNSFPVRFKPDDADEEQLPKNQEGFNGTSIGQWKDRYISSYGAIGGNDFQYTLYYSIDKQQTWTDVFVLDPSNIARNGYFVKDAGSYPFYLKMVNSDNCEDFIHEYTAVVQPANLSDASVTVNGKDEDYTAYYTGNAVTPSWTLQYNNGKKSVDLVNDTDYTVSYENNTDPGTATVTYTGKGNYTGIRTENFEIKYAFVPKQTTASAEYWYKNQYIGLSYSPSAGKDSDSVIYRESAESGIGLSASEYNYWIYERLQDAADPWGIGASTYWLELEEGVCNKNIYIKDRSTGYIGQPVELILHVDRTAPYWTDTDGNAGDYGIQIKTNWFRTLLNKISFGYFYNDTNLEVKIRANDAKAGIETSGVDKYYYYIDKITDPSGEINAKTVEELDALRNGGKFTEAEAKGDGIVSFTVSDSANFVVYAYAVDKAGNQSNYISSDGVIFDKDAPVVNVKKPSKADGTLKDIEVTLKVTLDEDATLMWFFVSEGVFQEGDNYTYEECKKDIEDYMNSDSKYPQFATQEDGKWMPRVTGYTDNDNGFSYDVWNIREKGPEYSSSNKKFIASYRPVIFKIEGKKGENTVKISDFGKTDYYFTPYPNKKVAVWIAAIDKAGNITAPAQPLEYTTTKAMPKVAKAPELNGTYGDAIKDLKLTPGVAKYGDTVVPGTWQLTDTRDTVLPVGTPETVEVTFTPDESLQDQYESIKVNVVPTLQKRKITIQVENMKSTYGNPLPGINEIPFKIDDTTPLVNLDTKEAIQKTLQLTGNWGQEQYPSAGNWGFAVSSNSANYDVTVKYYEDLSDTTNEQTGGGILHIANAPWKFVKAEGYQDTWDVTYGTDPISLAVEGKIGENRLTYTVEDAKDADGVEIPSSEIKEKLLHISDDGKVTVKGAGSATIKISVPDYIKANYTGAEGSVTVNVNIAKATVSPATEVQVAGTLNYGEPLSKLDLTDTVFYRAGSTVEVPGTIAWKEPDAILNAGAQRAEYVFTPDSTVAQNYEPYAGSISVTVNKATPTIEQLPVPGECIYHPDLSYDKELLGAAAKSRGVVTGIDGKQINGEWKFKDQTVKLSVGTSSQEIYFEPESTDYNEVTAFVNVTVVKAIPYISEQPTATYTHGDCLYNQQPVGGKAICGDGKGGEPGETGTTTNVPGTFTWKSASGQLTHTGDNGKEFEYIFTPRDTTSYETVTGKTTITVNQAQYPPLNPAGGNGVIYAPNSCEKVGNVELPQGWKWSDEDKEKGLVVDESRADVHAEYTGADAANYEVTKVSLTVYRSNCNHVQTTIEGAREATCVATGTTGNVVCVICKKTVSSGYSIPKDPTNHTSLTTKVIKAATTTEEGLMQYECTACGYKETKTIAKLPGGNHHTGTGSGSSGSKHHHSSSGSSESSAGTTASTTPTLPAAPTETPKTNPSTVKLPGTKTEAQKPADETGVKEPYVAGDTGKSGWDLIKNELQDALKDALQENQDQTDGPAIVSVDMNGATIVPGDIFDSIKGQDINVAFDMGDGITWTVNGMDITADQMKDIDLGVTTGADAGQSIPVDVINNVTGERYSMNLSLAYDGEFGFRAVLTVNMDQKNAGLYANLFYYNEDSGELEFICAGEIGTYGNVDLTFSHASDYVVVIDAQPMDVANADTTAVDASDDTEDAQQVGAVAVASGQNSGTMIWLVLLVIAVILAGAGIVLVKKGKKKEE